MPKKSKPDPLAEIEKTQAQLRDNIEESIQLVEKTQALITKAKDAKDAKGAKDAKDAKEARDAE